jgi:transposase
MKISTLGIDLAKNVFAIHGVDEKGDVVVKRTLRRGQMLGFFRKLEPCLIGMEACATSHYWARELIGLGHRVRLMPPAYVKPYVKRGKTDGADAQACCEAVTRPSMRFVPVKDEAQQSLLSLHRARSVLVRQKTQAANMVRSVCAEFGVFAAKGARALWHLGSLIGNENDRRLPAGARLTLRPLMDHLEHLARAIAALDREIVRHSRCDEACRRLQSIPGVGPIVASALVASIGDPARFRTGRDLAAWIGLTRRANASGGKDKGGPISKQGDRYLRWLLVQGAAAVIRTAGNPRSTGATPWLRELLGRKRPKVAMVAQANKMARIAWAVLVTEQDYRADHAGAPV